VAPTGPAMKCGLADGRYADAVLVGLDPGRRRRADQAARRGQVSSRRAG
jgi:hypothetical protein